MEDQVVVNLSDDPASAFRRVVEDQDRLIVSWEGKQKAALIPLEDLEFLEELEDRADAAEADRRIAEFEASGEEAIPWEEVRRELGLDH